MLNLRCTREEAENGARWELFDDVGLIKPEAKLIFEVISGEPVKGKTWDSWVHRKKIEPAGHDWRNRPTYLLGDVRALTLNWIETKQVRPNVGGVPLARRADKWVPSGYLRGPDHPAWKGDEVGYGAVHCRLRAKYGTPTDCAHCHLGGADPFQFNWALNWDRNPVTRVEPTNGLHYSLSSDDYIRLCRSCHKTFDLRHAREVWGR